MALPTCQHLVFLCLFFVGSANADDYVDLTYNFDNNTMALPGVTPFMLKQEKRGYTLSGYWHERNSLQFGEHAGTHLDAPVHAFEGGWAVDQIPIDRLVAPGVKIDLREKVKDDPSAELTSDDLMAWLDDHGPLPDGVVVFVHTGWGTRYGNKTAYFGTDSNDTSKWMFPGINPGAAQILTSYEAAIGRRVVGVGIDTPSLDRGGVADQLTHAELAKENVYGLENVANLDRLPTTGFDVTVLPMKVAGGSGAPVRILATLPSASASPATPTLLPLLMASGVALLAKRSL
ncbi:isatin hydrolase-like [Penaeus japonicus]|uniref:isatin hydrolase-like n=1 Tax=Penaeus japonicus TaxID=27405 RepID=UPI001C7119D3|nr:isatin hydrolase-like [Penaeus japonicus]